MVLFQVDNKCKINGFKDGINLRKINCTLSVTAMIQNQKCLKNSNLFSGLRKSVFKKLHKQLFQVVTKSYI
jgi:hypothetical protein